MRRLISNIAAEKTATAEYKVEANFVVYEYQMQSTNQVISGRAGGIPAAADRGRSQDVAEKIVLIHAGGMFRTFILIEPDERALRDRGLGFSRCRASRSDRSANWRWLRCAPRRATAASPWAISTA